MCGGSNVRVRQRDKCSLNMVMVIRYYECLTIKWPISIAVLENVIDFGRISYSPEVVTRYELNMCNSCIRIIELLLNFSICLRKPVRNFNLYGQIMWNFIVVNRDRSTNTTPIITNIHGVKVKSSRMVTSTK